MGIDFELRILVGRLEAEWWGYLKKSYKEDILAKYKGFGCDSQGNTYESTVTVRNNDINRSPGEAAGDVSIVHHIEGGRTEHSVTDRHGNVIHSHEK